MIAVSYPNLVCFISSCKPMLISLCAVERYNWFKSNEGLLCHNPHRDIYGTMRDDFRRSLVDYVKPCKKNRPDQNRSLRFQRAPLNRLIQCVVVDGLQHLDLALDQVHSARPRRSAVRRGGSENASCDLRDDFPYCVRLWCSRRAKILELVRSSQES